MSYIGNQPTSVAFLTDQFNGTGSQTAFTMSVAPANTASVLVAVSGVLQDPSTYSVSGTTLTFSAAPPSGTGNVSARYLGIPASGVTSTAYRTVTEFTATAGQTTFTVPSYTAGFINVYRNGAMLGTADFTATNGTTVVLATGATAGDLVATESFYVSSVLNAIPATAGAVTTPYLLDASVTAAKMGANGTWAPTGAVIQVVNASTTTGVTSSTTSYADTTLTATITPKFTTSKILVLISHTNNYKTAGSSGNALFLNLCRNGSQIIEFASELSYTATALGSYFASCFNYQDSPATTSATTYKTQLKNALAAGTVAVQANSNMSTITLLEIAG